MKKKILIAMGAMAAMAAGVVGMSAFEAHVINVTAHIENAMDVPLQDIAFGTVFPQQQLNQNITFSLSKSFQGQVDCNTNNLIGNPGFESPIVSDSALWQIFPSGSDPSMIWLANWADPNANVFPGPPRPATANIELHRLVAGWLPHSGSQHTELDSDWYGPSSSQSGEPALIDLYQDVPTTIGKSYHLSYWFSPRPGTDASQNVLKATADGNFLRSDSADGSANANTVWTEYTADFVATNATTRIMFGGGGTNDSLGIFLDDVSLTEKCSSGRVNTVQYVIRQKPKCGIVSHQANPNIPGDATTYSSFVQVTEDQGGNFICPVGSVKLPLLCPYLSKHAVNGDGEGTGINSFHGLSGPWTMATTLASALDTTGVLSLPNDLSDTWNIDLNTPCFSNQQCGPDWANFVHAQNPAADPNDYIADASLDGATFGCDLWVEVTGIQ